MVKPVPLYQLFAVPLQSAVRAQALSLQETLAFVENVGLTGSDANQLKFRVDRTVEETRLDANGKPVTELVQRPFEVSLPLLALAPWPNMQLGSMDVQFSAHVSDTTVEPLQPRLVPAPPGAVSLASSPATFVAADAPDATLRVQLKIAQQQPEGQARITDVLLDTLAGRPTKARQIPGVEAIPGVGRERAAALRKAGIRDVRELIAATGNPAGVSKVASALGVSETRIAAFIAEAKALLEESE